jgi:LCP family protein required for cell wall assembly
MVVGAEKAVNIISGKPGRACQVRRAARMLALALAALLTLAAVSALTVWSELQAVAPRTDVADLTALVRAPLPASGSLGWKIEHNQRINILLLARGGAGNDNPNFTDSILVLSIRPVRGRATLVSVPRFLWVDIPALVDGGISGKLYSAFALGGERDNPSLRSRWRTATGSGDLAAATVAGVIGEPIDCWVAVGIVAFRALIDALGGIQVTVPATLDDSSYPEDDDRTTMHVHFDPGAQAMDGERALEYARSRLSTSEADRSARQELVMGAILARLRSVHAGPALLPLLGALRQGVLTNLRLSEIRQLDPVLRRVHLARLSRLRVDESNVLRREPLPEGDYLLVPRDSSLVELRRYVLAALP